jgi:hypothetical protein
VEVPDLEWWVSEEEVVEEKKPRKKFERVDAEYGV